MLTLQVTLNCFCKELDYEMLNTDTRKYVLTIFFVKRLTILNSKKNIVLVLQVCPVHPDLQPIHDRF